MRSKIKRCRDCQYYPNDCGYWDMNKRKKENATYITDRTEHSCEDFTEGKDEK